MRKLLIADFDSTYSLNIEENNAAVEKFRQNGNLFAFSTGRALNEFYNAEKSYNLKYDYLSVDNGSAVYFGKTLIYAKTFCTGTAEAVIAFVNGLNREIRLYNLMGMNFYSGSLVPFITKIKVICPNEADNNLLCERAVEALKNSAVVSKARHSSLIEIAPYGISKASAAEIKAVHAGIDESRIFCIGDSHSDISMLEKFNGFAVRDCAEPLKKYKSVKSVAELIDIIGV